MPKVNLAEKFASFKELWRPKIVADLNGQQVKLVRIKDEFVWHRHEREDELFLVVKGKLRICLRDEDVELAEGELYVVPRGVEHKPVAEQEAQILMFEPAATRNTGDVVSDRTVEPERI